MCRTCIARSLARGRSASWVRSGHASAANELHAITSSQDLLAEYHDDRPQRHCIFAQPTCSRGATCKKTHRDGWGVAWTQHPGDHRDSNVVHGVNGREKRKQQRAADHARLFKPHCSIRWVLLPSAPGNSALLNLTTPVAVRPHRCCQRDVETLGSSHAIRDRNFNKDKVATRMDYRDWVERC
ncbi:hypothetical protein BC628DRAFT_587113 [Trametes gibbosa]|nr:hypothetical protein BC628DRAFT_587113 [Trametes gibbosa]